MPDSAVAAIQLTPLSRFCQVPWLDKIYFSHCNMHNYRLLCIKNFIPYLTNGPKCGKLPLTTNTNYVPTKQNDISTSVSSQDKAQRLQGRTKAAEQRGTRTPA